MKKEFRCPFQIKWEQEKSILELQQESKDDLSIIWEWIKEFTRNEAHTALRIKLSDDFKECGSNKELLPELIDISTEAAIKVLELRLELKWLYWSISNIDFKELHKIDPDKTFIAMNLIKDLIDKTWVDHLNVENLAQYIRKGFNSQLEYQWFITSFWIEDNDWPLKNFDDRRVLTIWYGWTISFDLYKKSVKKSQGLNATEDDSFWIFTTPFYPEAFWRYSKDIALVITRVNDFCKLPNRMRDKIVFSSNTVLQEHWVDIQDVETDLQSWGLWLPPYK